MTFYVTEQEVWNALQVDLSMNYENSPPMEDPVDRAYIATLIRAAQNRMDQHLGTKLADMDSIPDEIKLALMMDVSVHYFDRLNPVLPQNYFYLIRPYRPDTSLIV
jgi:hypothetical protein